MTETEGEKATRLAAELTAAGAQIAELTRRLGAMPQAPRDRPTTDRDRTEQELRESEERYRLLFTEMQEGFSLNEVITDESGKAIDFRIIAANGAYERHTGIPVPDSIGRTILELIPNADRRQIEAYGEIALTGVSQVFEYFSSTFGRHFRVRAFSPKRGRFATIFEDVTERKQAEEALLKSEVRYRTIVENIIDALIIHDLDGKILDVNDLACRFYGYTREEFVGMNLLELSLPERAAQIRQSLQELRAGGGVRFEAITRRKDGARVAIEVVAKLVSLEGRGVVHGFVRDITERKRAEEEKAKLEGQLQQAQKMESVGRLAGGIAHDFNNMLGVILGNTEFALQRLTPEQPLYADLVEVQQAALRSAALTRQLLAFARKQAVTPKVLDLNTTVASILKMLQRLIGENVTLHWRPDAKLWSIKVDPSQIDQILTSLCVNARDAISGVGNLTIEVGNTTLDTAHLAVRNGSTPGDYVRLVVSDDGCGMDAETQAHLFEPFFTTKGVGQGVGLGLATVYGIVKQNNGFIDVCSAPGHGTTFEIYLPRHLGEPVVPLTPMAAAAAIAPSRETILLVEDEASILRLTKGILERMGYIVLAASTPGEAIRLATDHSGEIHLLVTDVIMPEMNGHALAENLSSRHPRLKRLFMSGYPADVISNHVALDVGVNFIQKPFLPRDLAAKVREVLGAGQTT